MHPHIPLLLITAALLTYIAPTVSITRCPPCGTAAVPYPLSTTPTCGDQSYKIRCNTSTATLHLDTLNNSYPITSITTSIQRLVIAPASLLPNTCIATDLVHQGVQLNQSLPFNVTSANTIMYLNCSDTLLGSPLDCNSTSLCHTYVNSTRSLASCNDASSSICCTFRTGGSTTSHMIRLREAGCRAFTSFVNLDADPILRGSERWPDPGLEIQWASPREPVCLVQSDCEGNSTCGADLVVGGSTRRCFCNKDLVWDPIQGVCTESEYVWFDLNICFV